MRVKWCQVLLSQEVDGTVASHVVDAQLSYCSEYTSDINSQFVYVPIAIVLTIQQLQLHMHSDWIDNTMHVPLLYDVSFSTVFQKWSWN